MDEEFSDDLPPAVPFRTSGPEKVSPHFQLQDTDAIGRSQIEVGELSEDEFEPAGTIRPEVELHFQRTANPFHEAFDEEEVVLDPYTIAKGDELSDRSTPAYSYEEMDSSSSTTPWAGGLPTQQRSRADEQASETVETAAEEVSASDSETTMPAQDEVADLWRHIPQIEESGDTWLPAEAVQQPAAGAAEQRPASAPPKLPKLTRPIPVTRLPPSLGHTSDEEMIVVDDTVRPPQPVEPKKPPPKRPKEFTQLFARLRRE